MSPERRQVPEIYSEGQRMEFATFVYNTEDGPDIRMQIFYLPKDEKVAKYTKHIVAKGERTTGLTLAQFRAEIAGNKISRRLIEEESPPDTLVRYDLPRWPVLINIQAKENGSTYVDLVYPGSESVAAINYSPEGAFTWFILLQDQGADWIDTLKEQAEYENRIAERFAAEHPTATPKEISKVRTRAFENWFRLHTGKNTVVSVDRNNIAFFDNEEEQIKNNIGRLEKFELGRQYEYFGDRYQYIVDPAHNTIITLTTRDNGRRRVLSFPQEVGDANKQLRDPESFYWAQIPWIDQIKLQVTTP